MLMYRQIDRERNAFAMTVDEFPEHIKALHAKLEEQKELDSMVKDVNTYNCKLRIYCNCPNQNYLSESRIHIYNESTLKDALQMSYKVRK